MTEKDELTPDNQSNTPDTPESNQLNNSDDLDVEGALAALASLQDLTREAEDEPQEEEIEDEVIESEAEDTEDSDEGEQDEESLVVGDIQTFERVDSPTAEAVSEPASYDTSFPRPPVSVLHRGQLASVVPALLLIGIGGYLTFVVTTSAVTLQAPIVAALLVGGFGAMLLAQWISTSRWAIGSFFVGVLLLLTGSTVAYLMLPNQISLASGYPLVLTAIGSAFVITDVFVPSGRRIWLIGLILAIAGLAGLIATMQIVDLSGIASLTGILPIVLVVVAVLLIAPFVRRRQQ